VYVPWNATKAYVVGRGSGIIKERPLKMGGSMTAGNGIEDANGPPHSLDIEAEFGLLENTLAKLHMDSSATGTSSTSSQLQDKEAIKHLKELGLERLVP
jgi:hypothetical protein